MYRRVRRNAFELPENEFLSQYRLGEVNVRTLCEELRPALQRVAGENQGPYVLSCEDEVLVTLLFYGSGAFQHVLASNYEHGMCQSSVSNSIERVTNAIINRKRNLIRFPTVADDVAAVKAKYLEWCRLPNVLGAIDCTHVNIKKPLVEGNAYMDRKGNYSLNVQLICGHNLRIFDMVARWPGSVHDSFIWHNSQMFRNFHEGRMAHGYLLGDSGYALEPFLMTPLFRPATAAQNEYNKRHIRGRNCIERLNGIIKSRFRCLDTSGGALCYEPGKVCRIIAACCILHNMCVELNIPFADDMAQGNEQVPIYAEPHHYPEGDGAAQGIRQQLIQLCAA